MRNLIYILTILFLSCSQQQTNDKVVIKNDTAIKKEKIEVDLPKTKIERTKFHTDKDTICIYSESKDTFKFSRQEFNDIVDNFPELTSLETKNPDTAYYSKVVVDLIDSNGKKQQLSFSSEVGQDTYYILYAYFLKNKNGIEKYSVRRKKLIEIYNTLNSIFGNLNNGGTYFGHQCSRIEGYAEFSIYWFRHYEDYFDRTYDISKQKAFYIAGLKQLIKDEIDIDNGTEGKYKIEKRNKLFAKVDILDKQIIDNFYLRMAQSFQSNYY